MMKDRAKREIVEDRAEREDDEECSLERRCRRDEKEKIR